jgi:hypothetical protein
MYKLQDILAACDALPLEVKEVVVHYMTKEINQAKGLQEHIASVNAGVDGMQLPEELEHPIHRGGPGRAPSPTSYRAFICDYLSTHESATRSEILAYVAEKKNADPLKIRNSIQSLLYSTQLVKCGVRRQWNGTENLFRIEKESNDASS